VLALVLAAAWLWGPEPAIRLFRPHELLAGVDDVQLTVIVLAAAALKWAPKPALAGLAAFLYLLKVPGAADYLSGVVIGVYATAAALTGRNVKETVLAALGLAAVQAAFETMIGPRWWLPFAATLLLATLAFHLLRSRREARRENTPAVPTT
jgi:hypothetical protein